MGASGRFASELIATSWLLRTFQSPHTQPHAVASAVAGRQSTLSRYVKVGRNDDQVLLKKNTKEKHRFGEDQFRKSHRVFQDRSHQGVAHRDPLCTLAGSGVLVSPSEEFQRQGLQPRIPAVVILPLTCSMRKFQLGTRV